MTAGLNLVVNISRDYFTVAGVSTDDSIGGAVPTGTVLYQNVGARIFLPKPTQALLEQGAETRKIYEAIFSWTAKGLRENDLVEVVAPNESWYFGYKFRIIGEPRASLSGNPSDPRSYVSVSLQRFETGHGNNQI